MKKEKEFEIIIKKNKKESKRVYGFLTPLWLGISATSLTLMNQCIKPKGAWFTTISIGVLFIMIAELIIKRRKYIKIK